MKNRINEADARTLLEMIVFCPARIEHLAEMDTAENRLDAAGELAYQDPETLVEKAQTCPIAHKAALMRCYFILGHEQPMPAALGHWLAQYIRTGKKPKASRTKFDNTARDGAIFQAFLILKTAKYRPLFENPTSPYKSGCAVIAALSNKFLKESLTPDAVTKIVNKALQAEAAKFSKK
jgi:hypothetical protein